VIRQIWSQLYGILWTDQELATTAKPIEPSIGQTVSDEN
jgi:hypothetical protein